MEFEHTMKVLPIDTKLQAEVEKLNREGWQLIPEIPPVAVYHLIRPKAEPPPAGAFARGQMLIDESKVFVTPANKKN